MIDYHEQDWPDRVLAITGGSGVAVAVNAAPDGAGDAIRAVRDGGRLATITSDPPEQERGITVSNVYVRPDGGQLDGSGGCSPPDSSRSQSQLSCELRDAADALATVVSGRADGAVALTLKATR